MGPDSHFPKLTKDEKKEERMRKKEKKMRRKEEKKYKDNGSSDRLEMIDRAERQ